MYRHKESCWTGERSVQTYLLSEGVEFPVTHPSILHNEPYGAGAHLLKRATYLVQKMICRPVFQSGRLALITICKQRDTLKI